MGLGAERSVRSGLVSLKTGFFWARLPWRCQEEHEGGTWGAPNRLCVCVSIGGIC